MHSARGNAGVKELSMVTDSTGLQWKNRVIVVDNVQSDNSVDLKALFLKIDAMPMRQNDMRN
jgi:PBP1b-binding outer membrane lipoprotein LpoB